MLINCTFVQMGTRWQLQLEMEFTVLMDRVQDKKSNALTLLISSKSQLENKSLGLDWSMILSKVMTFNHLEIQLKSRLSIMMTLLVLIVQE